MLRLAREEDAPLLAALWERSPVAGTQALALWHTFRRRWQSCCLWLGGPQKGPPVYALCHYEHHFILVGDPGEAARGELAEFLKTQPVRSLEGEGQAVEALAPLLGGRPRRLPVMVYTGQGKKDGEVTACREFSLFFKAMAPYCSPAPDREEWLGRVFPLVQQGCCAFEALWENGALVCGGALETAPLSGGAVISSLFTREEARGRGLARRMVLHLCAMAQGEGKKVYLVCGAPSLAEYYQELGFAQAGSRGFLSF